MVRKRRIWDPDSYYHIVMRGNNRQRLFFDDGDIQAYDRVLNYVYYKYIFELHAYCLMTNHIHLLLRSPHVHISKLMGRINKRYSDYFRKRYDYTGQIYERRYYANDVTSPQALLDTSAYIHLNPIETHTPIVQRLQDYPHSSYPDYYYNRPSSASYMHLNLLPETLASQYQKQPKTYAAWCLDQKRQKHKKNIYM